MISTPGAITAPERSQDAGQRIHSGGDISDCAASLAHSLIAWHREGAS